MVWEIDPATETLALVELVRPTIELHDLDSAMIVMRPFFLPSEDAYLTKVVEAIVRLSDKKHSAAIKTNGLQSFVNQFISGNRLVGGGFIQSGRLETDNESGEPGQLLSSGQIAMDYIYGVALHEDDDRLRRLSYVSGDPTILMATAQELAHLVKAVATVRKQIRSSADNGHLSMTIVIGRPSALAMIKPSDQL